MALMRGIEGRVTGKAGAAPAASLLSSSRREEEGGSEKGIDQGAKWIEPGGYGRVGSR